MYHSGGDAPRIFETAKHLLDRVALFVASFLNRYGLVRLFRIGTTGSVFRFLSHALTSSLSYALSANNCLGDVSGSSNGFTALLSDALPGVSRNAIGRPFSSVTAWTFVARPPQLLPIASEPPPFYRWPSGEPC